MAHTFRVTHLHICFNIHIHEVDLCSRGFDRRDSKVLFQLMVLAE